MFARGLSGKRLCFPHSEWRSLTASIDAMLVFGLPTKVDRCVL